MPLIEFEDGAVVIDAEVIAKGLGIEPELARMQMRTGKITSRCERGVDDDAGTFRLSFFTEHKRLRVIVNAAGEVIRRTTLTSSSRRYRPPRGNQARDPL